MLKRNAEDELVDTAEGVGGDFLEGVFLRVGMRVSFFLGRFGLLYCGDG